MVNADDLALEKRPHAFDPVRVNEAAETNILAFGVVHRQVRVVAIEANEGAVFVGQERGAALHVLADVALQRLRLGVRDMRRAKLAIAFDHAEHDGLVGTALRTRRLLVGVLVLLLAADERRIGFNLAFQRRIERIGARRVAQAMQDEPRRLLSDFQVFGERGRGDALGVVRDEPDRHEPLAQRQFRILEDRPDFDRKALAALAALERLAVAEMVDAVAGAIGAKLAVAPADRTQMIDAGLFVREGVHQVKKGVEIEHVCRPLLTTVPQLLGWVKLVYRFLSNRPYDHTKINAERQRANVQSRIRKTLATLRAEVAAEEGDAAKPPRRLSLAYVLRRAGGIDKNTLKQPYHSTLRQEVDNFLRQSSLKPQKKSGLKEEATPVNLEYYAQLLVAAQIVRDEATRKLAAAELEIETLKARLDSLEAELMNLRDHRAKVISIGVSRDQTKG